MKFCEVGMWHGNMNRMCKDYKSRFDGRCHFWSHPKCSRMPDPTIFNDALSIANFKNMIPKAQKRIFNDSKKIAKDVEFHHQFLEAIGSVLLMIPDYSELTDWYG